MDVKTLLTHAGFVRALARSLVREESGAADVEQQTWLAALEHPPGPEKPLRAWLARVARNFARRGFRDETRRRAREASLPSEAVPSPEEILEREEARRHMVEALLDLEEPYRSTILLRFYEDLPVSQVALRLGVPRATVKTRIARGLARLRGRLDARYGGERKGWCLALAPLAGLEAKAAASLLSATTGALAMTAKVKVAGAAVLLLGGTLVVWQVLRDEPAYEVTIAHSTEPPVSAGNPVEISGTTNGAGAAGAVAEAPPAPDRAAVRVQRCLSGTVRDRSTDEPVRAFDITVFRRARARTSSTEVAHRTVRHEEGSFSIPVDEAGLYSITVRSSRHLPQSLRDLDVPEDGLSGILVRLDPGMAVIGRVLCGETGEPVPGAIVAATQFPGLSDLLGLVLGFDEAEAHATTDDQGRFVLRGLKRRQQIVAALHPEFAEGFREIAPDRPDAGDIHLGRGHRLFGRTRTDAGAPAAGVAIHVSGSGTPVSRTVLTGAEGEYRSPPVAPGWVHVRAMLPTAAGNGSGGFTEEWKSVEVLDQNVEVDFGVSVEHVTWRGNVLDCDGEPLPNARLYITPREAAPRGLPIRRRSHSVACGEEGEFVARKLLPGTYGVEIWFRNHAEKVDWGDTRFDAPGTVERDVRISGGLIAGVVVDGRTGTPISTPDGSVLASTGMSDIRVFMTTIGPGGRFRLTGLPAGTYGVSAAVSGYPAGNVSGVVLEESEKIDDLCIKLLPGGILRLRLAGFVAGGIDEYRLDVRGVGSSGGMSGWLAQDGSCDKEVHLRPGQYHATLSVEGCGVAERDLEIVCGQTTELPIGPEDLKSAVRTFEVAGSIARADGVPLAGATLLLLDSEAAPSGGAREIIRFVADSDGRFRASGLPAGSWSVHATFTQGGEFVFPDLTIDPDGPDLVTLDLVLPSGEVSGALRDRHSGRFFDDGGPVWWVFLRSTRTGEQVAALQGGHRGRRFILVGVPEGEYWLEVTAVGYQDYRSAAFTVGPEQHLDLKDIELDPAGVLDLEVVDQDGRRVTAFHVVWDGKELPHHQYVERSLGVLRCSGLPLGEVTICVRAEGFLDQDVTTRLEPGQPGRVKVVLERP
ncbi:MAG: sigma-70 family RNA polymerase sigma factor [Planctomycetes bacterium]|nr:sigma-70 family RNA polymerase sigma factor [Planctomycetota bacterium]